MFIALSFGLLFGHVSLLNCFAMLGVLDFVGVEVVESVEGVCQKDSIVGCPLIERFLFPGSDMVPLMDSVLAL